MKNVYWLMTVSDDRSGLAVDDDADVERGAAHVAGDDVLVPEAGARYRRAGDPADRTGRDREQRAPRLARPARRRRRLA